MPLYDVRVGYRTNVMAKIDIQTGAGYQIKKGRKGYAIAFRPEDKKILIRWRGYKNPGCQHNISDIEFV